MKSVSLAVAAKLRDEFERSYAGIIDRSCARVFEMFSDRSSPASVYWPNEWGRGEDGIGGQAPADPLTFYVSLPFYEGDDRSPYWHFSLKEVAAEFIELHENGGGGHLDDEAKAKALKIAAELRALAEVFEQAAARE